MTNPVQGSKPAVWYFSSNPHSPKFKDIQRYWPGYRYGDLIKRFLNQLFSNPFDRSLRAKVTFGIAIPLVLVLSTFTIIEYTRYRSDLLSNLSVMASYNGQLIEDTLQHSMLESNFVDVQRILDVVGKNQNFRVVYIINTAGKVIFASNGAGIGVRLDNTNPTCRPCHDLPSLERPKGIMVSAEDGQRVFRSMQPIENNPECSACHDPQQRLIGLLLTDIYTAPFETALASDLRENLFWALGLILVTLIVVNLAMGRLVVTPLEKVAAALAGFGSGNRDLHLETGSQDEIGQLKAVFNKMAQQIQAEESENQALSQDLQHQTTRQQELLKRLITAQEDERKRVARELHDDLGQSLSGLALHSEVMEQYIQTDPERALEQLSLTRGLIDKTTQQMYELILALRPSILDDLGLVAALRSLAKKVLPESQFTFTLDSSELKKRLPSSIETALYRIFQEALSNIVRHSGANHVTINLAEHVGIFTGEIFDNGHGFNPETISREADNPRGLGLLGIQERVGQCGGTMQITSRIGEGTRLQVRIPLPQVDNE